MKCWDLESNKVIRRYHGHLSAVHCLDLHPTLNVLLTGGRDSVVRVWDMRTKSQVHCLTRQAKAKKNTTFTNTHDEDLDVLYAVNENDDNDVDFPQANDELA